MTTRREKNVAGDFKLGDTFSGVVVDRYGMGAIQYIELDLNGADAEEKEEYVRCIIGVVNSKADLRIAPKNARGEQHPIKNLHVRVKVTGEIPKEYKSNKSSIGYGVPVEILAMD